MKLHESRYSRHKNRPVEGIKGSWPEWPSVWSLPHMTKPGSLVREGLIHQAKQSLLVNSLDEPKHKEVNVVPLPPEIQEKETQVVFPNSKGSWVATAISEKG